MKKSIAVEQIKTVGIGISIAVGLTALAMLPPILYNSILGGYFGRLI